MSWTGSVWAEWQSCGGRIAELGLQKEVLTQASTLKAILVALSGYEQSNGETWSDTLTLAEKTEFDRKTVITALRDLAKLGFIEDTGKKAGRTKQCPVWRLVGYESDQVKAEIREQQRRTRKPPNNGTLSNSGKNPDNGHLQGTENPAEISAGESGKAPNNGSLPITGPLPLLDAKAPNTAGKDPQQRDTINSGVANKYSDARAPARGARAAQQPESDRPPLTEQQVRAFWGPQLLPMFEGEVFNALWMLQVNIPRRMNDWPQRLRDLTISAARELVELQVRTELELGRRPKTMEQTAHEKLHEECTRIARQWQAATGMDHGSTSHAA